MEISPSADSRPDLQIGTSGWHHDHWRGTFYPPDLSRSRWLEHYARRLPCVEINNSFYRFPSPQTIRRWREAVPRGFRFALKVSRYITHQKRLKECGEPLRRFLDQASLFGDQLGPVLFQLPPRWRLNVELIAAFLDMLPSGCKYAFEFRDPRWHTQEVYDLLAPRGVAFCQYEIAGLRTPDVVTADLVYVRLHGPGRDAYCGSYSTVELAGWAARIERWRRAGLQVWIFFDNDEAGYAMGDALRLSAMLGATLASPLGGRP